ncbi:hypothetical protein CAOG_02620 [Capsaspora owczarzaki ATCC 30864]|uniref:Cytochrome c oxidase assembly protein COX20, mitochondrial n=1 Tax=Capsaspora owczarzaki (strain ATCC 30864) TaxID=595528 RepID=A0A0D2WLL5_CAPO3|nr:hypothetical protein CAOG_02620 [Capsaspora owczarzaki ATCC 30864]KJE91490.1 hypothetical protein CAOG_002620 [Capsaspora owczarzaki ATCC 30864]|eukprot:XP_004349370.1 hypothetical protein CAOG_02620 [Capsaspora owczarzaki ATCC 30864]
MSSADAKPPATPSPQQQQQQPAPAAEATPGSSRTDLSPALGQMGPTPPFWTQEYWVRVPCARQSALTGLAAMITVCAVQTVRTRDANKALTQAAWSWFGAGMISWWVCRYNYRTNIIQLRRSVELYREGVREKEEHASTDSPTTERSS